MKMKDRSCKTVLKPQTIHRKCGYELLYLQQPMKAEKVYDVKRDGKDIIL
jgi:hypothetical protein